MFLKAERINATFAYKCQMRKRKSIAEGAIARLKFLGLEKLRLRGLTKIDIIAIVAATTSNILKALPELSPGQKPALAQVVNLRKKAKQVVAFFFPTMFIRKKYASC